MEDIKGFEGLYAITSCGRVWSYRSKRFLKLNEHKNGYLTVRLYRGNGQETFLVHRLVAETYIPKPNDCEFVNHKDENKTNNCINNLEWCTRTYNQNYGTIKTRANEKKQTKVECIETGQIFNSMQEACDWLGLNRAALTNYFKRGNKTCGGYTWRKL